MKPSSRTRLAGGMLVGVLGLAPAACLLAQFLMPGGGAALERLVVACAELLVLSAVFLTPGLALPRMGDWHPAAIWLVLAWFLLATCATLNAGLSAVALVRQAEWVLHGIFAAMASVSLSTNPALRRRAALAVTFGLFTALGLLAASWSPPWGEWGRAWAMIADAPLVGIGGDQYAYLRPGHDHPGNSLLQLALDWGVPGALVFLTAMAAVVGRGLGRGRWLGPAMVLGLMAAGLVCGTLYHSSILLYLSFGIALCLDLEPVSQGRGFDKDIHGLAILCAAVLLVQVVLVRSLLMGPVPPVGSLAAHLVRHVPMAMGWETAGSALDRWATQWRLGDKKAAYELLDWSARHARRPQESLRLEARWFQEDGFEAEARYTLGQAEAAAK
jgi:hypothetical protein